MHLFSHVSEFGVGGYQMLPLMALMSSELTVWSPSAVLIRQANAAGKLSLSTRDVLDLIEAGVIRVAARQRWLENDPAMRNRPEAEWDREFDGAILRMAREDAQGATDQPRVRVMPDEQGYDRAREYLESSTVEAECIVATARVALSEDAVPIATRERIGRQSAEHGWDPERDAVLEVIRNAYNHRDATRRIGAHAEFSFAAEPLTRFNSIFPPAEFETDSVPRMQSVTALWDLIKSLKPCRSARDVVALRSQHEVAAQLWSLSMHADPLETLRDQIEAGLTNRWSGGELLGDTAVEWGPRLASAMLTLFGVKTLAGEYKQHVDPGVVRTPGQRTVSRRNLIFGTAAAGIGIATLPPAEALMRETSLAPDRNYKGPVWPFIFHNGQHPTRHDIEWMLGHLTTLLVPRASSGG